MALHGWRGRLLEAVAADGRSHREVSRTAGLGADALDEALQAGGSPTVETLLALCGALGVGPAWVIDGAASSEPGGTAAGATGERPRARGGATDAAHPPYAVTYLQTTARPPARGPAPEGAALVRAEAPPAWWFLALYDAVGSAYHWTDMHARSAAGIEAFVQHPRAELWTLTRGGWPQGFFLLDAREPPACDLAYFGLVPEAVGRGLGGWLLRAALERAWAIEGTERVTVNTCTLDHPRALPNYLAAGFEIARREDRPGGT